MRIGSLFQKDISRPINGVVKADQLDEQSVWQELDEFVVTQELDKHFRRFFERYVEAVDNPKNPDISEKIGVWISGFFGSGKSHFIKVLSYLLANQPHSFEGESKKAVEFFQSKISDAMLFGDIQRAVASHTDVILFNIDSKADASAGRDAILAVFLKVLNELQGYSGDHTHIAHLERYLEKEGKLEAFHAAYQEAAGAEWVDERDAYQFNRDQVVEALSKALGQSPESCAKWVDSADSEFSLTVENFCKWVREYLDKRGAGHRLIFLVDEVGQFIGQDTHLMLNLQTITEELGTLCKGRAWVVVTSQEDIDAVLGELNTGRANDFSKIQGRFKTRLSLSSANVDEVIQARLLAKVDAAKPELSELFEKKGDILKNQLTFRDIGTTFKSYEDADDFVANYPFAPYQFRLLQRIFESIRKAGATGLHLAQGERSLLDAFQSAGKAVANSEIGVLVPLYLFYPSIESFLDTSVKRTIDYASENPSLEAFDTQLLQVLFLIRYVDEIRGNVDNLVTLCLSEIDADRLALKRTIEGSLQRLEKQTLISRTGDNYFFLTNEERDVNREIKAVDLSSGDEATLLGQLIFDDVLRGQRRHRFAVNKMDFPFNRICDLRPVGNRAEGALTVSVITPLAEGYELYSEGRCIVASGEENGQALIRLPESESLGRELRSFLKTDKYLRTHDDGSLPSTTRRIHRDLAEENRHRREQLTVTLADLLVNAAYYIAGQRYEATGNGPLALLEGSIEYLISNTFNKMGFLAHLHENPLHEIQALLRADDVAQQGLDMELPENNPQATQELRDYLELCARTSRKVVLHDMVNDKYANRPYGWPAMEVILLLTRIYVVGEVQVLMGGAAIPRDRIYEATTTSSKWRSIVVQQRITANPEDVRRARELGRELFSEMGPDSEDGLFIFLRGKLEAIQQSLSSYRALADTGEYPGKAEIDEGLGIAQAVLALSESNQFLSRFNDSAPELRELAENFSDLSNFYTSQKPAWDRLRAANARFKLNRMELDRDEASHRALARMQQILEAPAPYGLIHETEQLISAVAEKNGALLNERREKVAQSIAIQLDLISRDLEKAEADDALKEACLGPIQLLNRQISLQESLAHLAQAEGEAVNCKDEALSRISLYVKDKVAQKKDPGYTPEVKSTRVVTAKDLFHKSYIETPEDAAEFVRTLKAVLDEALENDERIEIR
jgi:hypothetical protein